MKWNQLHKTKYDDDSEKEDEEDSQDNDEQGFAKLFKFQNNTGVNRIRAMNFQPIIAAQQENNTILLADMRTYFNELK